MPAVQPPFLVLKDSASVFNLKLSQNLPLLPRLQVLLLLEHVEEVPAVAAERSVGASVKPRRLPRNLTPKWPTIGRAVLMVLRQPVPLSQLVMLQWTMKFS